MDPQMEDSSDKEIAPIKQRVCLWWVTPKAALKAAIDKPPKTSDNYHWILIAKKSNLQQGFIQDA